MIKDFYIIGSGGLSRELLGWFKSESSELLQNFQGFVVDDHLFKPNAKVAEYPVIPLSRLSKLEGFQYLIAIGDPKTRRDIHRRMQSFNGELINYIHHSAVVGERVTLGKGVVINPRTSISSDVTIGDCVLVNCNTGIGHDCFIGDYSSILGGANINGGVEIGELCLIGSGVTIHPNKVIMSNVTIGIGSVVLRNVKRGVTVFGNPAKKIGK